MNDDHDLVQVSQARPGMVLSDELIDSNGLVMLARGAVLSEATIASLRRHHIDMVPIARAGAHRPPDPAAVQARLAHLFRHHPADDADDWAGALLRRYVEDYRMERAIASGTAP